MISLVFILLVGKINIYFFVYADVAFGGVIKKGATSAPFKLFKRLYYFSASAANGLSSTAVAAISLRIASGIGISPLSAK